MNAFTVTDAGVEVSCVTCAQVFLLPVSQEQVTAWENGALIQNAMPNLPDDQRELFLSGYCGECFDSIFFEDEEDDDFYDYEEGVAF